jgi:hypothetical protein
LTARKRPCTFSKDGTTDDDEQQYTSTHNSPSASPTLPASSPQSIGLQQQQTVSPSPSTNSQQVEEATEILNRLCKIIPNKEIDTSQLICRLERETPRMKKSSFMPAKSMQQHLIQLYFKHCYSTWPMIPKRLFFKQLESSNSTQQRSLINPILLYMMFAHGAQYQQKTIADADSYFKQAKSLLDYELAHPTLSTIIALVLMALYDSSENTCSTMYSAMAFQLCSDLDLMRNYSGDYNNSKPSTTEQLELKKRICWSCYYLDKLIHLQNGQPWMIKRQDIELDLPLLQPGDDVIEHEILEGFSSMIKLLQIAERVLQPQSQQQNNISNQPMIRSHSMNDNSQILSLNNDNELLHWLRSLPSHLQWTPLILNTNNNATPSIPDLPSNPMLCQLHLMYNIIELYVLKPYSTFNASKSIYQRSITIATNMTRLITTLSDNSSWIFNYPFTINALFESIKMHLRDCSYSDKNLSITRHAQTMFQQAMRTMKNYLILDMKRNSITPLVIPFLSALDQVLTDANTTVSEEIMANTPFEMSTLNSRHHHGVEEERQQWSKLDYFANGLVTPPTVKSKSTGAANIQYYHPPVMTTQNPFHSASSVQHSAMTDNNLFHLSTSSWRPNSNSMSPNRIQYNAAAGNSFYNNSDSWQHQHSTRKSPNNQESSDIAAIVAQIQQNKSGSNSANTTSENDNDWNNNNNTNSNQSTPSQHEDLLYTLLQQQQEEAVAVVSSRPVVTAAAEQQPRFQPYPYMNVGLGIYASAHQHHNDVIRQHLPVSTSSGTMRPAAILTHQGQVIVQNSTHLHNNNQ